VHHDDNIPPLHVLRRVAAAADADPRTVARFLAGEHIRSGAVAERIARAVSDAGLTVPPPKDERGAGRRRAR
jgi:hypothetical protein